MAMGIVSDADLEKELNNVNRPIARVEEKKERGWNGGRKEGDTPIPDTLKKVIGASALEGTPRSEVAKIFGVSESSVSAYKHGVSSTARWNDSPDKSLNAYMKSKKVEISNRARGTLFSALDKITEDKLEATKAKDLAGIAKDMSAIIRNMEDPEESKNSQTTIVFYSPKEKPEESYEVIDVRALDEAAS